MKYKEFKKAVEDWGRKYNYSLAIETNINIIIYMMLENDNNAICAIDKSERFVIDLNWRRYRNLSENAKCHLFDIVTEFAATKPADRKDEKRFIIPLPGLITTDGRQQYLTHKDCKFFASRSNPQLRQTWKEEHLKFIPEIYRQFAVEFDEEKEY